MSISMDPRKDPVTRAILLGSLQSLLAAVRFDKLDLVHLDLLRGEVARELMRLSQPAETTEAET